MFSHLHVCTGFTTGFDGGDVGYGSDDSSPGNGGKVTSPTVEPPAKGHAPRIENLHNIIQDYAEAEVVDGEKPKFVAGAPRARGQPLAARRKQRHPSRGIHRLGRGVRVRDHRSRRESKSRSRHRVGRVQDAACSNLLPRFGHSVCGIHDARLPHVWRIGLWCTT